MAAPTHRWRLRLFVVVGVVVTLDAATVLDARTLRHDHVDTEPAQLCDGEIEGHLDVAVLGRDVSHFNESVHGLDIGSPIRLRGVTLDNANRTLGGVTHELANLDVVALSRSRNATADGLERFVVRLNGVMDGIEERLVASMSRASDGFGDRARSADWLEGPLEETMEAIQDAAKSTHELADALAKACCSRVGVPRWKPTDAPRPRRVLVQEDGRAGPAGAAP